MTFLIWPFSKFQAEIMSARTQDRCINEFEDTKKLENEESCFLYVLSVSLSKTENIWKMFE